MPPSPASRGVRSALAPTTALLAAALLVACGGMSRLGGDKSAAVDPNAGVDRAQAQSQAMMFYLELLHRMVRGGPAEQAEIFANVKRDYDANPNSAPGQLRYALALAAPNHPSSDALGAQKLLRQALSAPEQLTAVENAVAFLEIQKVDRQLALAGENARLTAASSRSERDRVAALNRRLATEEQENAQLRKALEEARAKLDAIATIERQSTERKPPNPERKP